jgi:hypothetical protein
VSVESTIYDTLKGLVGNRVFPDVAPENTVRPYMTYQQVGGEAINFLDATVPSKRNGRWQVNVWADSRLQAAALSRQAEDAMRTAAGLLTTVLGAPVAIYEPDTKLFGAIQDFSCWFDA